MPVSICTHCLMRGAWLSVICLPMQDKAGWEKSRVASEHARRVTLSSLSSSRMMCIISGGRIRQRGGVVVVWGLQRNRSGSCKTR